VPPPEAKPESKPQPEIELEEEAEAEPEPQPERPRRGGRWRRPLVGNHANDEEVSERESSEDEPTAARAPGWQLGGSHFVLSFERLTSILSWRNTVKIDDSREIASSGADVSFLTAGVGRTASALPRIMFDGIVEGGFTIGGGLGFGSSSGSSDGTASGDLPTNTAFLIAGRLGYFLPASESVALWFRGGLTRTSITGQVQGTSSTGQPVTFDSTITAVNVTLDPQIVLVPVPHVGITLGPLLDLPLGGTSRAEGGGESAELDYSSAAYGVTAGASAIF
jgi:hypothetical protein